MISTNLGNGRQIRHLLEIIGRKIGIASRSDLRQSVVDLRTEFLLEVAVVGQLPTCKGQLENS